MMGLRTRSLLAVAVALLISGLTFSGCAKKPVVGVGGPTIASPGYSASPGSGMPGPSTAPGGAGSSGGEIAVTRPPAPQETAIPGKPGTSSSSALPGGGMAASGASPLKDIFFEYDKAIIDTGQRAAMDENVRWLKANATARVLIEGHCDERGSAEYNLGLGDRRVKAVREYLVTSGIAPNRIGTISYGKERPFAFGHDESSWKQNRRVHFAVQGQ